MSGPRIGVLTFHRCINYGSYWQSRCLVEGIRARGLDAVLLDHECRRATIAEWRCAFQPKLPERTERAHYPLYAAKARRILRATTELPLSAPFPLDDPGRMDPLDLVVVGSDEVWNLSHPWYGGRTTFYGAGLRAERVVSYAASFGNYDASAGLDPYWTDHLRAFDAISVRDENSRAVVAGALGIDPAIVLDPCLQFPPPAANLVEGKALPEQPYILVYGHGFPDSFAESVRRSAVDLGYRLVSVGYVHDWADEQRVDAGPEEFARLVAGSSAVATNFFHGCVFALLNDKPFACSGSPYRFNKVRDLTRAVGAEARLVFEGGEKGVAGLLAEPLDMEITCRISDLRARSNAYLDRVLV